MRPLVRWAVQHGIGHAVFSRWLKPLFLQEARRALMHKGLDPTDSALALAAGLHRGDIHLLDAQHAELQPQPASIPVTHQVLANWALWGLPGTIPFKSPNSPDLPELAPASFVSLVQRTPKAASQGFSASLILQDMERQGLVISLPDDTIQLQAFGHWPHTDQKVALHHIGGAVQDLLSAGLHNVQALAEERFLEQSLEVDGLHPSSVDQLHDEATRLWQQALQNLLPTANAFSAGDEPQGGKHRMRLGIYFYAEPMTPEDAPLAGRSPAAP